ncbi:telomere repeats-binding bouquet formation protein 1 [Clupea harengus]|uniref:Telomere repeats-binding bouquet formation protein 1 n=1 Tax=Clupea harengus TaxID=7950 RepID=A0A8M1KNR7_CLUHA|nr:telomere repeats-binding bouquet formation protein 1 [Clupea harengus]
MQNATKTDLSLLLECLKCQMKCPDSQKQALLTISAICQQSEENVEFFQNVGGVMFVHSLSRSSRHPQVRQTALFILGTLAESNVYCKQALCRKETFSDLVESLQQDVPVPQKWVAVYMLSALVSNNRSGQEFAHTSDCIQTLLDLFRWSFPLSSEAEAVGETQMTQLWTAVSSALCGCVNNPQNELNQRVCMSAFPLVRSWLQQMSPPRPQLLQPLCSFIAMTLHNNTSAQEYFSSVGGLGTLCVSLASLVPHSSESLPACSMAITLTKTLAACITDNPGLAASLSGLQLVPVLGLLLSCPTLDHRGQLSVVLTMGLCTDSSEEHQTQLLANGGLPLIISLLTDTQDEELKKAATFVLQTCKKITGMLGPGLRSSHEEEEQCDIENHWKSAKAMLQRINNLEEQQAGVEQWERDVGNSTDQQEGTFGIPQAPPPQAPLLQHADPTEEFWEGTPLRKVRVHPEGRARLRNDKHKEPPVRRDIFRSVAEQDPPLQKDQVSIRDVLREREKGSDRGTERTLREREKGSEERTQREKQERRRGREWETREGQSDCTVQREREERKSRRDVEREGGRDWLEREREERERRRDVEREGGREERERRRDVEREGGRDGIPAQLNSASLTDTYSCQPEEGGKHTDSSHEFRIPGPFQRSALRPRPQSLSDDEMSICSEVLDQEIQRVLMTPVSFTHSALRCLDCVSGCVSGVCDVSSRSFSALLRSSRQKCETHLLLQRADLRHRQQLKHTHTHTLTRAGGSCAIDTPCQSNTHTHTHTSLSPNEITDMDRGGLQHPPGEEGRGRRAHGHSQGANLTVVNLTPLKRPPARHGRDQCREELISEDDDDDDDEEGSEDHTRKRERKNFSEEELVFLREGVRRFGRCWNSILYAYPFPPNRTNIDLAQKYRRMKKAEAATVGRTNYI